MNQSEQFTAHLVAIATIGIWGTTFISTKILLQSGLEPADIFIYRFVLAYVCTLIICHKKIFADTLKDEIRMFLLGLFGGSLYFLTENTALVHAQASDVSIVVSICPILTSLLMGIFYKSERMNLRQYIGLLIAFTGIILVILNGRFILHFSTIGYLLAFSAALTWALYSLIIKKITTRYSIWFINRKVFFYGIISIIPYYIYIHPLHFDTTLLTTPVVGLNILFLGLIASMLCFVSWTWAMRKIGTVKASVYMYLNPLFTILTAWTILNENITNMAIGGTIILLFGMFLAEKRQIQR